MQRRMKTKSGEAIAFFKKSVKQFANHKAI